MQKEGYFSMNVTWLDTVRLSFVQQRSQQWAQHTVRNAVH